jgi:hypothetical protein
MAIESFLLRQNHPKTAEKPFTPVLVLPFAAMVLTLLLFLTNRG